MYNFFNILANDIHRTLMEDTKYIHRTYVSSIEIIAVSLAFIAFYKSDASQYLGS